jgi:hypothetical protein
MPFIRPNPVDQFANAIENGLSYAAVIPGVGLIKVALGTAQTIIALALTILFALPLKLLGIDALLNYTVTHIKHGLMNIATGLLEAIPIVGIFLLIRRIHSEKCSFPLKEITYSVQQSGTIKIKIIIGLNDGQGFKIMRYESLQKANLKLVWSQCKQNALFRNEEVWDFGSAIPPHLENRQVLSGLQREWKDYMHIRIQEACKNTHLDIASFCNSLPFYDEADHDGVEGNIGYYTIAEQVLEELLATKKTKEKIIT